MRIEYIYEDHLQLIELSSIDGPAFVIENFKSLQFDGTYSDTIISIASRDRWSNVYNQTTSTFNSV